MFFVHIMGRFSRLHSASTLEDLGKIVTRGLTDRANDSIMVSVGNNKDAVMPYVWIRRNVYNNDKWEGELGDCIKLGIKDGLLVEKDPIQMLSLDQAIAAGIAEVLDDGRGPVISMREQSAPKQPKKLSNDEKVLEARRMVKSLFASIRDEDD